MTNHIMTKWTNQNYDPELMKTLHLTLKMTTAQVETSITYNSLSKDCPHPDKSHKTNNWYSWVQTIYMYHHLNGHTFKFSQTAQGLEVN